MGRRGACQILGDEFAESGVFESHERPPRRVDSRASGNPKQESGMSSCQENIQDTDVFHIRSSDGLGSSAVNESSFWVSGCDHRRARLFLWVKRSRQKFNSS